MKDIFAIKGLPLTASSRVLAGHVAPGDSTVWRLLSGQGVVLLGHTHAAEFAAWGWALQTKNPWRRTLIAPGSSTGSGVALAARMVPLTTGSDTSGSLRAPASAFGVSSLKPTFGLVSRNGMIPTAWTFDHLGPMARAARDLSLLLAFMAARDRRDPATFARGHGARYPLSARRGHRPLAGVRVGVPDQYFGGVEVAPGIESVLSDFRRELRSLGATLVHFRAPRSEIDNSLTDSGFAFGLNTVGAEAGVFHRQFFPEHKDEYTEHVRTVLTAVAAANPSASDYIEGQRQRAKLMSMWGQAFREHRLDAVLQPAAFLEMPTLEEAERDSSFWFRAGISIFEMWNYTGFPVLALPAGRSPASGMPVGVQLVGLPDTEARLLQIGIDCQAHYPHHRKKPPDIVQ